MHGLIFKIKESHRQDQSESIVIHVGNTDVGYQRLCFLFFTTSQMKSLHYDQCWLSFVYIQITVHTQWYSLFHRDETKPTHIKEINTFLFLMQLIYKHSSPNDSHMTSYESWSSIWYRRYSCVSWSIFNRIHFFAICDALWLRDARCMRNQTQSCST